jgi:aspartyl/asparaginyl beta-hydroxylase (cupin superfamily)
VRDFPELTPIRENCATIAAEAREHHDKGHIVHTPVFRFINRFVTRHVAKLTSSRNVDTDRLGVMNLLARVVHKVQVFFTIIKRWNRRVYYSSKYVLIALLAYLIFFPDLISG